MKVPYVDIKAQHQMLKAELLEAFEEVVDDGGFILGEKVSDFERKFAEVAGTMYAVGVNSGTDAILLTLRALGVGAGDEVITAPNSFVATAAAISLSGATPVFADVGKDYNIAPVGIEARITSRTKAIVPVHLTGRPAEMDEISHIGEKHGLHIVEDCAQAVGAGYGGRPVGSFGIAGCFSLHPLKTLNACGDGGVVTTNDVSLRDELFILRNLGLKTRDTCVRWSGNSRLDTMQAAFLLVKMKYLAGWTEKRRLNASRYRAGLEDVTGIRIPDEKPYEFCVYHTLVAMCKNRDRLKAYLGEKGIGTAVHYPVPIHLQKAAENLGYGLGSFPNAEKQAGMILSLPVHQSLTEESVGYVINSIREFYEA